MRRFFVCVSAWAIISVFLYVIGAFISASFDISQWHSLTRLFVGLFSMVIFVMSFRVEP